MPHYREGRETGYIAGVEPESAGHGGLHVGRLVSLAILLVIALALASSDAGREFVQDVFEAADELMATHPRAGVVVFVLLSALSAMLAFFSSAVLLPVAIHAWGDVGTFGLLWLGWLLGGMTTYAIGKYLGRDVVRWIVPVERLQPYEQRFASQATFWRVLFFHMLVPSEMPGYVLGLLRYPFLKYLAVLAIAEIPFALGAIYLGKSFVEGNLPMFMLLGAGAILFSILTTRWLIRHGGEDVRDVTPSGEHLHCRPAKGDRQ
jgi:uncharacterized membrane protein YdjX (TVP38/TMEM64 family)